MLVMGRIEPSQQSGPLAVFLSMRQVYARKSRAVSYDEPAPFSNLKVKKVQLSLKAFGHMFSYPLGRQYPFLRDREDGMKIL